MKAKLKATNQKKNKKTTQIYRSVRVYQLMEVGNEKVTDLFEDGDRSLSGILESIPRPIAGLKFSTLMQQTDVRPR